MNVNTVNRRGPAGHHRTSDSRPNIGIDVDVDVDVAVDVVVAFVAVDVYANVYVVKVGSPKIIFIISRCRI